MKKLLVILSLLISFSFTSCDVCAQMAVDDFFDTYYTIMYNGAVTPVIYIDAVPYYHIWENGIWYNRLVPFEMRHMIHHYDSPFRYYRPGFTPYHRGFEPMPQRRIGVTPFRGSTMRGNPNMSSSSRFNGGNMRSGTPQGMNRGGSFSGGGTRQGGMSGGMSRGGSFSGGGMRSGGGMPGGRR